MKKATGATWPFLSDPARTVQQNLRIAESSDPHHTRWCPTRSCSPRSWSSTRCIAATDSGADLRAMTSGEISARCYRAPGRTSIPRSANDPTTFTIEDALGVAIVYRAALTNPDLIHGATFPELELPDDAGRVRRLSDRSAATHWCCTSIADGGAPQRPAIPLTTHRPSGRRRRRLPGGLTGRERPL